MVASAGTAAAPPPPAALLSDRQCRGRPLLQRSAQVQLWPCQRLLARRQVAPVLVSAIPFEPPSLTSAALIGVFSVCAVRAFIYFRLQYIIAAMLGRYVPRGGCRVLDLSIYEGRNLYYYPKDVTEVVTIADKRNYEVIKNQAIRAGVRVDIKLKSLNSLGLPSNSMDAVVSVYSFRDVAADEAKVVLHEAVRVLKPGKPFIFVESVVAEWQLVRIPQLLIWNVLKFFKIQCHSPQNTLQLLEEVEGLEKLEYEVILGFQDPHIVGLAMKQTKMMDNIEATTKKRRKTRNFSP